MIKITKNLVLAISSSVLLSTTPLWAQEKPSIEVQNGPRWFQVEVAIFTQQHWQKQNIERWRRDIALAYPPNWVELRSPEDFIAEQEKIIAENEILTIENSGLEDSGLEDSKTVNPNSGPSDIASVNSAPASEQTGNEKATVFAEEELEETPSVDLTREPYFFLPAEEHQLQAEVNQLKRNSGYNVIFHQAWRQPMVELDKAPALLIEGGGLFGNFRELSGSLTLSVSRYLHLKTNLWLSQFEPNYGQERLDWPELPTRPSLRDQEGNALLFEAPKNGLWSEFNNPEEEYENILAQPYLVSQVVTLEQKRRMRSGEMHYIDHPLMGLLVKITRYELPPEDELNEIDSINKNTGI